MVNNLADLSARIVRCERCDRLRTYCKEVAQVKKREFRTHSYWGKPVPGFGDPRALLWIIGLAPAAHGANRTGRVFTGDSSGQWLFKALHRVGLSSAEISNGPEDGLSLSGVYISSTIRCAPPENKPLPEEKANCAPFLRTEYKLLKEVRFFLALGAIGFKSILDLLAEDRIEVKRPRLEFRHGAEYDIGPRKILVSYHPSRQNTQTGKLTESMWMEIFFRAKELMHYHYEAGAALRSGTK